MDCPSYAGGAQLRIERKRGAEGADARTGHAYAIVIELVLVIIAVVLVVMLILGAVWMLAALSR